MTSTEPLLVMEGISKAFPGVRALEGASLRVGRGEVHAVMGQNGAGKSTLIKILTGAYRRDAGTITLDGQPIDFHAPQQAQASGVSTIYQEVNLVPFRSVAENIFLGREPRRFGLIDRRRMHQEAWGLLTRLGVHVDVSRPLGAINVALQQMVAIARAISFESKLVVMDEPTSSLDEAEVATLFDVIRQLKAAGVSVVFVSHRLDEVYGICDRVTIMRDGRTVDDRALADITRLELVALMLGKDLAEVRRSGATGFADTTHHAEQRLLEARGLRGAGRTLRHADVRVRAGEIVGLAGLLGSGRTELARAIFGADPLEAGELKVDGRPVRFGSPADAIKAGIGLAPRTARPRASSRRCRCARTSPWRCCRPSPATASWIAGARTRSSTGSSSDWTSRPPDPTRRSASCPAATSRRCCWHAGCASTHACCCSTSRPGASTSGPRARSRR
jgi:monosaccharide-transporting ATPase